ncbi:transporter-domain-containing protein [Tuber indicum]|nr:transporter-domain-containing protein [Tuber indicum]
MSNPISSTVGSPDAEKPLSAGPHEHQPAPKNQPEDLQKLNSKLAHPLSGIPHEELMEMGASYARENGMEDLQDEFRKGALLAQNPEAFDTLPLLTDDDKYYLRREVTHKWSHPKDLYHMVVMCSMAAAVQGMDETVINGANLFFLKQFGIENREWIAGLVNSAPYLSCFTVGCWLTHPLNKRFGRRNTIFITCFISFVTCLWQGFTNTWPHLFVARFMLGFGIGPKSSTVPVYAAECSPPAIRGALVMMWQMWTAFGIMLGYIADVAFYNVKDPPHITGLNWRLMLASAMIIPLIVCFQVYFCPESPRYEMLKGRHKRAFGSLARLRWTKVQAARDLFYMHTLLKVEAELNKKSGYKLVEFFTIGRNRRAMIGSEIVMFMQQFCGVNVIAYYSSVIFKDSGFSVIDSLLASLGFGIINFLFAIPAVYTIDTFGRRFLLLVTFPLMGLFLLFTGSSFWIPDREARIGCVALGIYLFGIVYSPGEGPVPFTYSAEAYPLYIRDLGMSLATATTWGFNWLLSMTWLPLVRAFKPQGAFGYYAAWNGIGFVLVLLFLPETKGRTLEELDRVFEVPTRSQVKYGLAQVPWFFKRYIFRQDVPAPKILELEDIEYHPDAFRSGSKDIGEGNSV